MGHGLAHVQFRVESAFLRCPSATYSLTDLVGLIRLGADRRERVNAASVRQAADAATISVGWWRTQAHWSERPVIYYNPLDLRSYAMSRMRLHFADNSDVTLGEMRTALNDPEGRPTWWRWVQPGGAWWMHVEINKAWATGNREAAAEMIVELDEAVTAARERRQYLDMLAGVAGSSLAHGRQPGSQNAGR